MHIDFFSPAQCVGYVALIIGVTAFLQKVDWRLKFFNGVEGIFYIIHFSLLGNQAAVVSCMLSVTRSFLSIKFQKKRLAVLFIAANLGIGIYVMKSPLGLLPIIGSCLATWAAFTMRGIPMRAVFLFSTFCWLANNIISGSVGGTVLEFFIATANGITIARILIDNNRLRRKQPLPTQ